jgi:hypothetical protein
MQLVCHVIFNFRNMFLYRSSCYTIALEPELSESCSGYKRKTVFFSICTKSEKKRKCFQLSQNLAKCKTDYTMRVLLVAACSCPVVYTSVGELHHFYKAPASSKNFDAAPALALLRLLPYILCHFSIPNNI